MVFIVVILLMEKDKDMGLSNGIMVKNFKGIGKKDLKMGLEFGDLPKEIGIKENGIIISGKDKGFITTVIVYIRVHSTIS
jgi:hypothetical protein